MAERPGVAAEPGDLAAAPGPCLRHRLRREPPPPGARPRHLGSLTLREARREAPTAPLPSDYADKGRRRPTNSARGCRAPQNVRRRDGSLSVPERRLMT